MMENMQLEQTTDKEEKLTRLPPAQDPLNSLENKFIATMVLACVGDVLGYKNGSWEFNFSGTDIHEECEEEYGGVQNIDTHHGLRWNYSDDTVMHYATANALVAPHATLDELMTNMAKQYVDTWEDMPGRAPGATCAQGVHKLEKGYKWNQMPYANSGGGCGGSMRAACIGLKFFGPENRDALVAVSIESSRITHTHVNGFMGAVVAAAFVAYALEGIPVKKWGSLIITELIPLSLKYCKFAGRDYEKIEQHMKKFENKIKDMLTLRGISDGESEPVFPDNYNVKARDKQYKLWSFDGWGGASGDDSVMIAYDALLGAGKNWNELMNRGALHGGDSDSTGCIAGAWYGALYGFEGVPVNHYANVEGRMFLTGLGQKLYQQRDEKKIHIYPAEEQTTTTTTTTEQ